MTKRRKLGVTFGLCGLVYVFSLWPSLSLFVVVWTAIMGVSLILPAASLASWLIMVPLGSHYSAHLSVPAPLLVMVGLTGGTLVGYVLRRGRPPKTGWWLAGSLVGCTLISAIATRDLYVNAVLLTMVAAGLILAVRWIFEMDEDALEIVSWGALIAAAVAAVIASQGYEGPTRLEVADSVRSLSNAAGLATLLVFAGVASTWVGGRRAYGVALRGSRVLQVVAFGGLLVIVLAAASRGVMLALAVALPVILGLSFIWHATARTRGALMTGALVLLLMVVTVVAYQYSEAIAGDDLRYRMLRTLQGVEGEGRFGIWYRGLSAVDGWQWLWGTGPGTYRGLTGGQYGHSVFIDALVTRGFLTIAVLTGFLVWLGASLWRAREALGCSLLAFLLLSFATYGSTTSNTFALTLGLAYGLAYRGEQGG